MTTEKFHLSPEEPFPEHLEQVSDRELQLLDSRVRCPFDHEIVAEGEPHPETEFRRYELNEEI